MGNRGDEGVFQWLRSMRFYQWGKKGGPSPLTRWTLEHPVAFLGVATAVIMGVEFVLPGEKARLGSVGIWVAMVLIFSFQVRQERRILDEWDRQHGLRQPSSGDDGG